MTRFVLFTLLTAAGCAGGKSATGPAPPPAPDDGPDQTRFQGTWRVVRGEFGGEPVPAAETAEARYVFRGDRAICQEGDQTDWAEPFALDPGTTPKRITFNDPDEPGEKIVGIYKFDPDGTLTLCFVKGRATPPPFFDSRIDRKCVLMVLAKVTG